MLMLSYSASQLADFILSNDDPITKEELYRLGYPAGRRPELEAELAIRQAEKERKDRLPIEDDEMWQWACNQNTISAYQSYLSTYDVFGDNVYRGKYVFDARQRIENLKQEAQMLRNEMFEAMRDEPWLFQPDTIKFLIDGVSDPYILDQLRNRSDIASRFICTGQRISFNEMQQAGVVPPNMNLGMLLSPNYDCEQTNISELGDFPTSGRTDVFFLGVPRSGKSTVLAGIFSEMYAKGTGLYEPQFNKNNLDLCAPYHRALIASVDSGKYPVSTQQDSISFMKINLKRDRNNVNPLTFVELGGEAFATMAEGHSVGAEVWQGLGGAQCLQSRNRKLLTFVVDYSIHRGDVRQDNYAFTDLRQAMILDQALTVFSSDGPNPNKPEVDCTLSKVDTIAIIVTKSDLMPGNTEEEKLDVAQAYITEKFNTFVSRLRDVSKLHGINRPNNYEPYLLTFSIGRMLIGNSYSYDGKDSANIIKFISYATATNNQRGGAWWNPFR